MAKPKKFDSHDNETRFEDAHAAAQDALSALEDVLAKDLYSQLTKNLDTMWDNYYYLQGAYYDLQKAHDELTNRADEMVSSWDEVAKLERDIAVLSARLRLAGLSTSTKQPPLRVRNLDY